VTARCSHGVRDDNDCATCDDFGPAFAPLTRFGYDRTISWESAQVRDGYDAGRVDGARGRGSRARYRRSVVEAIAQWDYAADTGRRRTCGYTTLAMRDPAAFLASCDTYAERHERAAARARRILAALDQQGGG
jgi:hypothetical protein